MRRWKNIAREKINYLVCNSGDIGDEFHYIYMYIFCDVLFNLSNLYNNVIIYKIKEKSWKEFTEFSYSCYKEVDIDVSL
jgi:hypothetical protein